MLVPLVSDDDLDHPNALEPCPAGLPKTKATELEIVRWVARSIDDLDVRPEDCPDPFAWTLLRQCRDDSGFAIGFIEKLWSKLIPSRSQLETGGSKDLDGKVTVDLLERIQAFRDAATGGAKVVEEPEIPDAFGTFDPEEGK